MTSGQLRLNILCTAALLAYEELAVLAHNVKVAAAKGAWIIESIVVRDNLNFVSTEGSNKVSNRISQHMRDIRERISQIPESEFTTVNNFEQRKVWLQGAIKHLESMGDLKGIVTGQGLQLYSESIPRLYHAEGAPGMHKLCEFLFTDPKYAFDIPFPKMDSWACVLSGIPYDKHKSV